MGIACSAIGMTGKFDVVLSKDAKPNIILIMTDDQGGGAILLSWAMRIWTRLELIYWLKVVRCCKIFT